MSEHNGNGNGNGHVVQRTCPDCHRPVDDEGLTLFGGTNLSKGYVAPNCATCKYGHRPLFLFQREHPEQIREAQIASAQKRRKKSMSEIFEERMEVVLDKVLAPYFEALDLKPNEEWSPRTKLQFYSEQTQITEKMFNRTEGMPINRQRNVDKDDNDVARTLGNLPAPALERVVAAALANLDPDEILTLDPADVQEVDDAQRDDHVP